MKKQLPILCAVFFAIMTSSQKQVVIEKAAAASSMVSDKNNLLSGEDGTLKIEGAGSINVFTTASLTVKDKITNLGDGTNFIIESDANLIQINDSAVNSGAILVKRDLTFRSNERKEYNYFVSPVEGANLKTDIYRNTSGNPVTAPFVLYHQESNNKFYNSSGAYVQGRSLAVKEPALSSGAVPTAFFKGKPFSGLLYYPLAYSGESAGYNLVGNPYPSNLDLNVLYADNRTEIESTFRFWDHTVNTDYEQQGSTYSGNAYAIYNAAAGKNGTGVQASGKQPAEGSIKEPNHIVKIGQGFMVKSLGMGKVLHYSNHVRISDNTGSVFFGKETEDDRYWLQMTAPSGITSTIAVVYYEGGNNLFGEEDSRSLESSDRIYSIVETEKVAINGRAPFIKTDVIPLGTQRFVEGNYMIALDNKEGIFSNGQTIYLKDKQTGTVTNLSAGSYTFAVTAGESTGRFEIVYQPETVLATTGSNKEELIVYRDGTNFTVKSESKKIDEVEMFDAAGKLIKVLKPNSKQAVLDASALPNGVYILKVTIAGKVMSKKIIR